MKRKHNVIFAGLLGISILLCGCANTVMPPKGGSESSKTTSDKIDELVDRLPEGIGLLGQTLTVLTPEKDKFVYDESAAGTVKNMVKQRAEVLEAAYQMKLTAKKVKESVILDTLKEAAQSGTPAGDLLCFSAKTTVKLQEAGLLADLMTLPYFDIELAASDKDGIRELTFGNALYLLPDPSALPYEETYALFYNRDLARAAGIALPEETVKAGNWTAEALRACSEAIAYDVMHKSSFDFATDTFGLGCTDNTGLLPDLLRTGAGIRLFESRGGTLAFLSDYASLKEQSAGIKALYDSASHYPKDGADPREAFENGRLGFYIEKIPYLFTLFRSCTFDYGILPLPKQKAADAYRSPLSTDACVFSVPLLREEPGVAGLGLTGICATGGDTIREAELTTLLTLYSSDNDQSVMLDLLLRSASFDFGTVYGSVHSPVYGLGTGLFSEVFAKGAQFRNEINEKMKAFTKFVSANFS